MNFSAKIFSEKNKSYASVYETEFSWFAAEAFCMHFVLSLELAFSLDERKFYRQNFMKFS